MGDGGDTETPATIIGVASHVLLPQIREPVAVGIVRRCLGRGRGEKVDELKVVGQGATAADVLHGHLGRGRRGDSGFVGACCWSDTGLSCCVFAQLNVCPWVLWVRLWVLWRLSVRPVSYCHVSEGASGKAAKDQ